jgi:hypothetical protein
MSDGGLRCNSDRAGSRELLSDVLDIVRGWALIFPRFRFTSGRSLHVGPATPARFPCELHPARQTPRRRRAQPGDEQISDYTRERLLRMDQKFMARVERALECGVESLPAMSGFVEPRRR